MTQLNKLQIKAEILTVLSKLQTNLDSSDVDKFLVTLYEQEDKSSILDVLIKELCKANEQKSISICFLLLKLCDKESIENALWGVLKNPSVNDSIKTIILNILKEFGNKLEYEKLDEYFENPADVIDADTKKLLQTAIINPEAQIDFLDFLNSLTDVDKKLLVQSLGDDYSSDNLANILNPLVLYSPDSEIGRIAIDILGATKSQLAFYTLEECLKFVDDEVTIALIKRNISKLKISGVREENAAEFYKSLLSSRPYEAYTSYPDGHGNQAVIFSRERDDDSVQMVALVINDSYGLLDCFGFNEISKPEFERIVDKFYNQEERVYIDAHVVKKILLEAEKLTRKVAGTISYEYLCWKTLFSDIEIDPVPVELILKSRYAQEPLSEDALEEVFMMDFVQKWFFDTEYSKEFKCIIIELNKKIIKNDFTFDLESIIKSNLVCVFSSEQKRLLDKRILMSAYLKFLSANQKDAQTLYSLYLDEDKKNKLAENIIRKSIYEYYVALKFKSKEENKMTNIFAMRNKQKTVELSLKQIELMILFVESLWVK